MKKHISPIFPRPEYAKGLLNDLRSGFFLSCPPNVPLLEARYRHDDNPWVRLTALLEAAKEGDFADCRLAIDLVHECKDPSVWWAWSQFMGYVCPPGVVKEAFDRISDWYGTNPPNYVRHHLAVMITATQTLSLLPPVLEWCIEARGTELGESLEEMLSILLEPKWGEIDEGVMSDDDLRLMVKKIGQKLDIEQSKEDVSIRGGDLFSPAKTAQRMLNIVTARDQDLEDFIDDRLIFEATIGIDLRPCFRDGNVQPLRATALLEQVIGSGTLDSYVPGGRYFFGRPIPNMR